MKTKLAAVMAAAALAGCGGGDEGSNQALSYSAYGEEASQVCEDLETKTDPVGSTLTGKAAEDAETLSELAPLVEGSVDDFEALDPPAELEATHEQYLGLLTQFRDGFADAQEAAEAGDTAEYQRVLEDINALGDEAKATGSRLGAEGCT